MTSASTQVVEEYKKFMDFEDEVVKGTYNAFQLRFVDCKKKFTKAFLELDLGVS